MRVKLRKASKPAGVLALISLVAFSLPGCRTPQPDVRYGPPQRHSVRSEQLVVLSDFRLPKDHELFQDLVSLREQVTKTLHLPRQRDDVVVYLFETQEEYRQYLNSTYPGLPERRAYFVGTPGELAVYTYWGDRIQEDLRHESTHGLLHATLSYVPLWLDEGFAEYFEQPGETTGQLNSDYIQSLTSRFQSGWRPNLKRLESLRQFQEMQQDDYEEAWLWVHYMLHGSDTARDVLLEYVYDLRTDSDPQPLSVRLRTAIPNMESRLQNYLATIATRGVLHAAAP